MSHRQDGLLGAAAPAVDGGVAAPLAGAVVSARRPVDDVVDRRAGRAGRPDAARHDAAIRQDAVASQARVVHLFVAQCTESAGSKPMQW